MDIKVLIESNMLKKIKINIVLVINISNKEVRNKPVCI